MFESQAACSNGVEHLQEKLMGNLGPTLGNIVDVVDGVMKMRTLLPQKRVLIVLDDVDDRKQLWNLVGDPGLFKEGSRIIITTRNQDVIGKGFQTFEADPMKTKEALRLFSMHAFDKELPLDEYHSLSLDAIESTRRLPLALEVIDSRLQDMPRRKCAEMIKGLKKMLHKDVQEKLMISIEALDHGTQQIFLHITCFYVGHERTFPVYM